MVTRSVTHIPGQLWASRWHWFGGNRSEGQRSPTMSTYLVGGVVVVQDEHQVKSIDSHQCKLVKFWKSTKKIIRDGCKEKRMNLLHTYVLSYPVCKHAPNSCASTHCPR